MHGNISIPPRQNEMARVMERFTPERLPVLSTLAREFVLCDESRQFHQKLAEKPDWVRIPSLALILLPNILWNSRLAGAGSLCLTGNQESFQPQRPS